jgi:hypothetical protein
MTNKDVVVPATKCGDEPFIADGKNLGFILNDFWRWNISDLLNNLTRGHLAEFIVAKAIGHTKAVRDEWSTLDLETPDGTTVEVKSAAYIQSWPQKDYSTIKFNIGKTMEYDWATRSYHGEPERRANVYVFALLAHKKENVTKDKQTVNPLDLNQWEFFVLPTKVLDDRSQNSITLKSLQDLTHHLAQPMTYDRLADAVRQASKTSK